MDFNQGASGCYVLGLKLDLVAAKCGTDHGPVVTAVPPLILFVKTIILQSKQVDQCAD